MKLRSAREREVAERLVTNLENAAAQFAELAEDRPDVDAHTLRVNVHRLRAWRNDLRDALAGLPFEVTS